MNKANLATLKVVERFKKVIEAGKQGEELTLEVEGNLDPQYLIVPTFQRDP